MPALRVDGSSLNIDELSSLLADSLEQLRYLNATDASQRYGTGYGYGVIEVTTKS